MLLEQYPAMFRALPISCLILDPDFIIREMTDEYLRISHRDRETIHRRNYFDFFEEDPLDADRATITASVVRRSLEKVRDQKVADHMPVSRYDMPDKNGVLQPHYWTSWSVPLLDREGNLMHIMHRLEDITRYVGVLNTVTSMGNNLIDLSQLMSGMLNGSLDSPITE